MVSLSSMFLKDNNFQFANLYCGGCNTLQTNIDIPLLHRYCIKKGTIGIKPNIKACLHLKLVRAWYIGIKRSATAVKEMVCIHYMAILCPSTFTSCHSSYITKQCCKIRPLHVGQKSHGAMFHWCVVHFLGFFCTAS